MLKRLVSVDRWGRNGVGARGVSKEAADRIRQYLGERAAAELGKPPTRVRLEEEEALEEFDDAGEPFRKLQLLPPAKERLERRPKRPTKEQFEKLPPRSTRMLPTQDWPSVWPTAASFKASAVPLPVRMGWIKKPHMRVPPGKHANLELMKIPNFLHLTPTAIHRHCDAIKKFCTKWPEGLETEEDCTRHFPMKTITCDYVHSGPSVRDPRARIVTTEVLLSSLPLDYHAKDKLLRLVGDRYHKKTDILTIITDRCPARQQNRDYAIYLLIALVFESNKTDSWEKQKTEADMERYFWKDSRSEDRTVALVRALKKRQLDIQNEEAVDSSAALEKKRTLSRFPEYLSDLSEDSGKEDLLNVPEMKKYIDAWDALRNEEETADIVLAYGDATRKLLGLPSWKQDNV